MSIQCFNIPVSVSYVFQLQCGDVALGLHLRELRELWNPDVVSLPKQDNGRQLEVQYVD